MKSSKFCLKHLNPTNPNYAKTPFDRISKKYKITLRKARKITE